MAEKTAEERVKELEGLLADANSKITDLERRNKVLSDDQQEAIKRRDSAIKRAQDAEAEAEALKSGAKGVDETVKAENEALKAKVAELEGQTEQYVERDKARLASLIEKLPDAFKETLTEDIPLAKRIELAEKLSGTKAPGYRQPGEVGDPEVNPWKKETLNLTQQAKILRENPEMAERLKAAAKR